MTLFAKNRDAWLRRAEAFSDSKSGTWLLALIAFADSSVLPVLPDLLLVPMLLLRPGRSLLLSTVCVVASCVGAFVGYGIGYLGWSAIGQTLVQMYGQADNFHGYQKLVEDWGIWIIIAKSFTPIPFKFIAIAAGVASMNLLTFAVAVVLGRTLHFSLIAILVAYLSPQILQLIEKYQRWLVGLGVVTAIGFGIVYSMR